MPTFEEQMNELERVVEQLEHGGLPLEESVTLFENGMRLSAACKSQLATAESRIQVLLDPEEAGPVRTKAVELDAEEDSSDDAYEGEEDIDEE